jgi:fructose-specific phosphotransferase system IIC component
MFGSNPESNPRVSGALRTCVPANSNPTIASLAPVLLEKSMACVNKTRRHSNFLCGNKNKRTSTKSATMAGLSFMRAFDPPMGLKDPLVFVPLTLAGGTTHAMSQRSPGLA